jgi:hypothetical protein
MAKPRFYLEKYFPQLLQRLEENLKVNKELEIRFTEIGNIKKKYDDYIPLEPDTFKRVKDYFTQRYGTPKETHSEDRIKNGKRQSIVINEDGSEEILAIEKASLWDSKTEDYNLGYRNTNSYDEFGIKISLAKEVDIKPETKKFVDPDVQRTKHRYSWKDGFLQYDITRVIQEEKGKTKTMYEMEIEVIQSLFHARNIPYTKEEKDILFTIFMRLDNRMRFLWTILNDSDVMFKRSELDEVESMIQDYTNSGEYRKDAFVVKARNLKFYDLVHGGLMGGKVEYTITPKAEGLRKFLVIDGRGVWLIYPGDQYCLVERAPSDPEKYRQWRWFNYRNTILDGEDILPERRKENIYQEIKHFYLPFDTLIFKGQDVRRLKLIERQKFTDEIRSAVGSSSNLLIKQKPFVPLGKNMKTFFEEVNSMFETMEGLEYNTDGLVFTPINAPYNPHSDKLKDKRKRNLVDNPDICKWKPANEYTVDLKVIRTPSNRGLFASNGKFPDELFKGNQNAPFDPEIQVDWYHPMFADIYNNAIVEFGPKLNSDGIQVKAENDGIIFVPIRIREDKQYANSIAVAQDTWNDLNNPIQEDTIRGKTLQLVRKYHNVVKRNLFDSASGADNHLIDIGSGYGGDISKTNKYSRILAIEPDAEHMEEFRRRLALFPQEKQRQISTLIAGGEEYEKIMTAVRHTFGNDFGKKPLYISMMLSMTFFWKSEEMLQQLANTINLIKEEYYRSVPKDLKTSSGPKNTVKFLFLVMDGERVVKYLKENDDSVNLNGALINYKDGIVYIDIPGTIVERQTEYPVYLKDLRDITDMEVVYEKVANEEKFLSKNESKYTSLYMYGEYTLPNKPIYLFQQEKKSDEEKTLIFPETEAKNFIEDSDVPFHNTLFHALFKAFNPDVKESDILPSYVLLYRKEIMESIEKVNPFDLDGHTIFESAGNGFLKDVSENIEYAKQWIFSDNELSPDYISWIPDVIGSNINVNGIVYETSIPTNGFIELDYEPSLNVYTGK